MTPPSQSHQRQCVWIVRYGLTEFTLVEGVGPYDSDIDPTEGVVHATAIADRIASSGSDTPKVVFSDPFLRTTHTADIIAKALPGPAPLKIEEGLTEWMTPSLLVDPNGNMTKPRTVPELKALFPDSIDASYVSINPCHTETPGSPKFEETEEDLLVRCRMTLERLLDSVGADSFALVSHAPCNQMLALCLEGSKSPKESSLGPWSLGGVTKFSRICHPSGEYGSWTLDFYSDTSHMPGDYKVGKKGKWSLPSFVK